MTLTNARRYPPVIVVLLHNSLHQFSNWLRHARIGTLADFAYEFGGVNKRANNSIHRAKIKPDRGESGGDITGYTYIRPPKHGRLKRNAPNKQMGNRLRQYRLEAQTR
jgi:hypothetical protein